MSKEKKFDGRSKEARAAKAAALELASEHNYNVKDVLEVLDGARPKSVNAAVIAADRPTRKKTASSPDIQATTNIPKGYIGRWVSDEKDRIQQRLDLGYQFLDDKYVIVGDPNVSRTSREVGCKTMTVGHDKEGHPIKGYLMVQRMEWYNEDLVSKEKVVQRTVEALGDETKKDGSYGEGLQFGQ